MFFKNFGSWVAQVGEAIHFESRERAWKFIHEQRVTDVALREVSEQGTADLKGMQT